jgi:hypothetical protein
MRKSLSRRFAPRVDGLENRWCPASSIHAFGSFMVVLGDAGNNAVDITHDGTGNVTVVADGETETASGIRRILVATFGGDDAVNFTASGALTRSLDLALALGSGNDTSNQLFRAIGADLRVGADLGDGDDTVNTNLDEEIRAGADVNLATLGRDGNDSWTLSVNEVRTRAELGVLFSGGDGTDTFETRLGDVIESRAEVNIDGFGGDDDDNLLVDAVTFGTGGPIAERAEVDVDLAGGDGNDTVGALFEGDVGERAQLDVDLSGGDGDDALTATYTGNIAARGDVELVLNGGDDDDTITATYAGEVDGELSVLINGGDDNDTAVATVTVNAGSTGDVRARVNGNDGDDNLTLNVPDASAGGAEVKAKLDGGDGFDTCVHTPNVDEEDCEA